jgi:DedD protein
MPFFKFRRGDASPTPPAGPAAQAQSVEAIRKRARHRLIGAAVLVLLGVVGFPLLFDTQPRPVAVDIPIEIPGKKSVKPLVVPAPGVATAQAPASTPEKVAAAASLSSKEEIYQQKPDTALSEPAPPAIKKEAKTEPKPEVRADAKADAKPPAKPSVKAEARPAAKPAAESSDGERAIALLNGAATPQPPKAAVVAKPAVSEDVKIAATETKGRMVVQVGAFADTAKADETRRKLEKAGLKTYTQIAETKDGKRIRVRVGPFTSKAEAEKAVGKIRSLDLPVAILSF